MFSWANPAGVCKTTSEQKQIRPKVACYKKVFANVKDLQLELKATQATEGRGRLGQVGQSFLRLD